MNNLILFINSFLSYALVFVIFVAVVIIAVKIGKMLRINKDAKLAAEQTEQITEASKQSGDNQ